MVLLERHPGRQDQSPQGDAEPMSLSEREHGGGANFGLNKAAVEQPRDSIRGVIYLSVTKARRRSTRT